jgi:hypothetical protein
VKKKLYVYLRSTGKTDWEHYIDLVCRNINHISQPAIGGLAPDAVNASSEYIVRNAQEDKGFLDYRTQMANVEAFDKKPRGNIRLGDFVFLASKEEAFGKSFDTQNGQLFVVTKILTGKDPLRYELRDLNGKAVPGSYYAPQLRVCPEKPDKDSFWLIVPQDQYQERTRNGIKEVKVRYLHYP